MNKRIVCLTYFSILLTSAVFSVNITIYDYGKSASLTDTKMVLEDDFNGSEEYDITWEYAGKLSYIKFNYTGENIYLHSGYNIPHGLKKYLVLYGNAFINMYDETNTLVYSIFGFKYTMMLDFDVKATSELKEGNVSYKAQNMTDTNRLIPWVEASHNDGIGEKITFTPKYDLSFPGLTLIISNGFVDYQKPYLYRNNNRIRKIRVYNVGYNEYQDVEIDDTPNYQDFYLDFKNIPRKIEIEILEVYKGTMYNDTCINLMMPGGF